MESEKYVEVFLKLKEYLNASVATGFDPKELFGILTSLHVKDGNELKFHLAFPGKPEEYSIGDDSFFYFVDKYGAEDRDIEKYLDIERTEMGVWQAYLLKSACTFLSAWWHGIYERREYIFCEEDLKKIEGITSNRPAPFAGLDTSLIAEHYNLAPEIFIMQDDEKCFSAEIHCCYWNSWKGLVQDNCVLDLYDNYKYLGGAPDGPFVIYEYDCGIRV